MPSHTKSERKKKKVFREFKKGRLHSGRSGKIVTSRKQAIAIALSEARRVASSSTMGNLHGKRKKRRKKRRA